MTAPQRVQRSRAKGWQAPPGTIYVGRPTRWGNPWHVKARGDRFAVCRSSDNGRHFDVVGIFTTKAEAHARAVGLHRAWLELPPPARPVQAAGERFVVGLDRPTLDDVRAALAGHHLACWCPPELPCHADTLLALANQEPDR